MSVRTRFAPSPTGYLHIGGARTALFNWLFARHCGGAFLLRIEDTDKERSTPEATAAILESMRWLGLDWDEGPFFQSERIDLYREHAERLLAAGRAYWCTCTPEILEAKRKAAEAEKRRSMYDGTCREAGHAGQAGVTALRFRAPRGGETGWADLVRGPVVFQNSELDDLVLLRSDGSPTYNFCVVVDDAAMGLTHILRGEDHIPNTPKQIQLYDAFDFPVPRFAHLPLILGLDRTRLSKRHGATSVTAYRDAGFLPAALVNYLARLGWSHGDQEIFSREEMVAAFSIDHVGQSAGAFDPEKLEWVNFEHQKALPPRQLAAAAKPFLLAKGAVVAEGEEWLEAMVKTLQPRARTLVELAEMAAFYFAEEVTLDPAAAAKHLTPATAEPLRAVRAGLAALESFDEAGIEAVFKDVQGRFSIGLGKIAQPVRVALTGGTISPGIYEVIAVLGARRTLARLDRALAALPPP
jgi:glutamyl-tRNA synthetase